jgi:hypothetical protein
VLAEQEDAGGECDQPEGWGGADAGVAPIKALRVDDLDGGRRGRGGTEEAWFVAA